MVLNQKATVSSNNIDMSVKVTNNVRPDIEGYSDQTGGSNNNYEPSGVFSNNNLVQGQGIATTPDPNSTIVGLNFKASKANALYKGSTLQTASFRALAIIKL